MSEFFKFSERSIDTKVGFGSYLGVSFGNLSTKDIDNVLSEAKQILDTKSATGKYATAVIQTESALKYFKKGKPDNYRVIIPITGAGINTSSNKD